MGQYRGIRAPRRARKVVITDLKWRATLSRRGDRSSFSSLLSRKIGALSTDGNRREEWNRGRGAGGEAVKCRFSRARRVNTARQSKDLPSSYYLIIGVILNRCKSHLQTEIVTSRRLGMLSNDLLERADPLCARRWAGKDTLRVQDERLDPSTYSLLEEGEGEGGGEGEGSYVFLIPRPNYQRYAVLYLSQRGKEKARRILSGDRVDRG